MSETKETYGPLGGCDRWYSSRHYDTTGDHGVDVMGAWLESDPDITVEQMLLSDFRVCGHNCLCPACSSAKDDRIAELEKEVNTLSDAIDEEMNILGSSAQILAARSGEEKPPGEGCTPTESGRPNQLE